MFKIYMQLIGLHTHLLLEQPLTLKLKKQHWHYILIDNITTPILSLKHQFLLRQQQEKDPCFQLQLLVLTSPQKGKIIGSALINIKQWPLERSKRDKVSLSPQIWLDLSIIYQYIMPKTPSESEIDIQLNQIQFQQEAQENKQLNAFIKRGNTDLQAQLQQLQLKNQLLIEKKKQILSNIDKFEKNHREAKRKLESETQKIEAQIIEAKMIVTNLVNMINQSGISDLVQELNEFLVKKLSQSSIL